MKGKNTIFINGQTYDAKTGKSFDGLSRPVRSDSTAKKPAGRVMSDVSSVKRMPAKPAVKTVAAEAAVPSNIKTLRMPVSPSKVHKKPQRSQTLHRGATKRPEPYVEKDVLRSPMISKFAPHPKPLPKAATPVETPAQNLMSQHQDAVEIGHPQVITRSSSNLYPAPVRTSKQLKEQLIKERLASVDEHKPSTKPGALRRLAQKQPKAMNLAFLSVAMVLIGGYMAYINMPNLSVRVASVRAGVNANFPEYNPDGYHFSGPVAYTPGEVSIGFNSNSSDKKYTIKQRVSNWDSQAVLDNYVTRESNSYLTYSEQGLTVYTFDKKAAWVNGGVLYTIDGDAPLSSEQILRIAASL